MKDEEINERIDNLQDVVAVFTSVLGRHVGKGHVETANRYAKELVQIAEEIDALRRMIEK